MTREEAIKRIKERIKKQAWLVDEEDMKALTEVVPELEESEDEKIYKFLTGIVDNLEPKDFVAVKKMNVIRWLEVNKENGKARTAVEKINEYIDSNTANAHDMRENTLVKQYYQGVDDTLSNISGILMAVYYHL